MGLELKQLFENIEERGFPVPHQILETYLETLKRVLGKGFCYKTETLSRMKYVSLLFSNNIDFREYI